MGEMNTLEASTTTEETGMEDLGKEDHPSLEDPLVNFTKAPTPNVPESQVGQSIKTKVDVSNARNLDISKMNAPPINPHEKKVPDQRKFEDYTYTYSGPDIQPQMQINSVNPNFASAYDQALGVIKDSLNTANPLASLNLQRVNTTALSCHPPSPSDHNIFQTIKNTV